MREELRNPRDPFDKAAAKAVVQVWARNLLRGRWVFGTAALLVIRGQAERAIAATASLIKWSDLVTGTLLGYLLAKIVH